MTLRQHPLYLQWLLRRKRLRRLLRPLPRRANVKRYPVVKWFADYARKAPYLWSFKRGQVLPALYVGSVISFLPIFGVQFPIAAVAALLLRANLTVIMGLQLITNPLTVAPIYGFTTWIGLELMALLGVGQELGPLLRGAHALFIGGTVVGLGFAVLADAAWRFLAWEARLFRDKLQQLRAHHAELARQQAEQDRHTPD